MDWWHDIYFAATGWFVLLPILLFIFIFIVLRTRKPLPPLTQWLDTINTEVYRHPLATELKVKTPEADKISNTNPFYSIKHYLLVSALLVTSLAGPYTIGKKLPEPPAHRDIVFLVDTSVSLVLRDYLVDGKRTARISVLKSVMSHFIEQLKGNRIHLIVYADDVYTLVPLTTDYKLLNYQLQRIKPASLTGRNSDLSKALLYALKNYQTPGHAHTDKPVFVMLTDAHRPVRDIDPTVAAAYVAEHGIGLHLIGIGSGSYEAKDLKRESLVYHPTSFYLLEKIAKAANGRFFWAKDAQSLAAALNTINQTEKRQGKGETQFIKNSLYMWPLLAALLWLSFLYLTALFGRLLR